MLHCCLCSGCVPPYWCRLNLFCSIEDTVAPFNQQTIPRLELLSCLLLAKLISLTGSTCDSDWCHASQTLRWHCGLKVRKTVKQFVQNRVTDIRQCSTGHIVQGRTIQQTCPLVVSQLKQRWAWCGDTALIGYIVFLLNVLKEPMPEDCTSEMKNTSSHTLLVATENPTIGQLITLHITASCRNY